ncbi:MAG: hypothetical protein V7739_07930 [Motiliproteus sp.]
MKAWWPLLLTWLLPIPVFAALTVTRIDIVNAPTPLWEEKVEVEIGRANRFLCKSFVDLPDFVRIFKTDRGPEYDTSLGMIFIHQDYLPVHLYHEYGHKVLDNYLQSRSAVLGYYRLRKRLGGDPLQQALEKLQSEIISDQQYLRQLQQKQRKKMAGNLSRWIGDHEALVFEASAVMHLDDQLDSPFKRIQTPRTSLTVFQMLAPYHELFADTFAVLMTGRWDSISMVGATGDGNAMRLGFVNLSPRVSHADILPYRAFNRYVVLDFYEFSEQEKDSYYTQFAPMRSYIRYLYEQQFEADPDLLVRYLAEAIQQQMELRLSSRQHLLLTLTELNKGLIASLQRRVEVSRIYRADNCNDNVSAIGQIN